MRPRPRVDLYILSSYLFTRLSRLCVILVSQGKKADVPCRLWLICWFTRAWHCEVVCRPGKKVFSSTRRLCARLPAPTPVPVEGSNHLLSFNILAHLSTFI